MTTTPNILSQQKLDEINARVAQPAYAPLLGLGVVVLSLAMWVLLNFFAFFIVTVAGCVAIVRVHRRDVERRTTSLHYSRTDKRFLYLQGTCEKLAGSHHIWMVTSALSTSDWKRNGGANTLLSKEAAQVGHVAPPFISTNVNVWGIDSGKLKLLFFPDAVLVYRDEHYERFSYDSLRVAFSLTRFVGHAPPRDAEIVGQTWQYVNKNGTPDRRYNNNVQIPVALYGELRVSLSSSVILHLQVSNRHLAAQFAQEIERILGQRAGQSSAQGKQKRQDFREGQKRSEKRRNSSRKKSSESTSSTKVKSAYEILGIQPNATKAEITSAYRKQAQMYHRDKVSNLAPEFQELADTKMKEINRSYREIVSQMRS